MVSIRRFAAVIFDFDGVIIDSERVQARAWAAVAGELGADVEITLGGIAGKLDRHIAPEYFPGHDAGWCVKRKLAIQAEMEAGAGVEYLHETLELVRKLAGTKRLGICSSSREPRIREVLAGVGLEDAFDVVVGQVAGEECKPSAAPYLKALRRLGVSAGDACAIEDSHTGVTAARAAGIYVIQLLHEGVEASPLPDAVVRSAKEIEV